MGSLSQVHGCIGLREERKKGSRRQKRLQNGVGWGEGLPNSSQFMVPNVRFGWMEAMGKSEEVDRQLQNDSEELEMGLQHSSQSLAQWMWMLSLVIFNTLVNSNY